MPDPVKTSSAAVRNAVWDRLERELRDAGYEDSHMLRHRHPTLDATFAYIGSLLKSAKDVEREMEDGAHPQEEEPDENEPFSVGYRAGCEDLTHALTNNILTG